MARSYLYPGRNKESLTPQERQLEALYDQIDTPNNRITPQQFFQTPEAAQLLDQIYGGLTDRLPPGSQIVSQTPGKITYRDPEGYEHNVIRKPDGQFTETTNRPAIVPNAAAQQQQNLTQQFGQQVQERLNKPTTFADVPPEVRAQLQAQSDAEQAAINQQGGDLQGQLLARLFGQGVNRSSIATNASARFAQQLGLVQQQQRADAANRLLGTLQYLTSLDAQRTQDLAGLYSNLSGQGTQRDIAGAGLDLDLKKLQESQRQFGATNYLDQLRTQQAQQQLDQQNSAFNKIMQGINAAGTLASGVGSGLSAFRALTAGGKK